MPNELENLLSQPMTPCPHCGTPNGADSETCLCCGKRMQETQNHAPDAPAEGEAAPVQTVPDTAAPGKAPEADEPPPLTPEQKRKRRLVIGLAMVCNVLLLAVVVVHARYINSPGYRVARLFRANRNGAAQQVYLQDVIRDDRQRQIMHREMKKYFDELDAQYREKQLDFMDYTEKCSDILQRYLDEEMNRYVKNRFHTELETLYDSYIRTILGEGAVNYTEIMFAFSNVIDNDLAPDDRTEALFTRLMEVNQDETYFAAAQNSEQAKNYLYAIEGYQRIRPHSPRAEAAALGRHRCVAAYCADLRERVHASDRSASKLHTFRAEAGRVLELWPENGDLQELRDWVQQLYINAQKQETLAYVADPQIDPLDAILSLRYALKELPGDAELQAAMDRRASVLKAELPQKLLEIVQDPDLGWGEAMWHICAVQELLPEDAEISALRQRMEYFEQHRLSMHGGIVGAEDLFEHTVVGDSNAWYEYSTEPVADAFGVLHEPYALYRFTAATTKPAVFSDWGNDFNTLRFKVFADRKCTGSGVLEVWGRTSMDETEPMKKVWTSPVLNRATNGLAVEIPLSGYGFQHLELRLMSRTGTVVMLLDEAYLE